jgi:ADP-ribose pyrophosphatase YjhB (NUDIX family)
VVRALGCRKSKVDIPSRKLYETPKANLLKSRTREIPSSTLGGGIYIFKMKKINYNQEDLKSHQGIGAIIKNKKGEILMQNHIKFGFWTIPVGKIKENQNVEEGLKEEIFDECNLVIKKFNEITSKNLKYIRQGKMVKVLSHLFEIIEYSGEMKNKEPEKHQEQIFMNLEKIKTIPYLSDMTLLYLENLGFKRKAKI